MYLNVCCKCKYNYHDILQYFNDQPCKNNIITKIENDLQLYQSVFVWKSVKTKFY